MPEQKRAFKPTFSRRPPPQKWVPVRKACLHLYKVPCITVLLIFGMYFTSVFVEEGSRKTPSRSHKERPNSTRKILVISYFRSGSSFTGDLLRSFPDSFYYFEPLRWFNESKNYTVIRRFVADLFDCRLTPWEPYLQWTEQQDKPAFRRNENYWRVCSPSLQQQQSSTVRRRAPRQLCFNRVFLSRFCRTSNFRVMKVARLPFSEAVPLMELIPELRIIHLVRDPRGVMHSRSQELVSVWCRITTGCNSPSDFCATLDEDLEQACAAANQFPDQYLFLRYEDLACQPEAVTRMIFDFLGMAEVPEEVSDFLVTHTKRLLARHVYLTSPYTTIRNSSAVAFQWRSTMTAENILVVEAACQKAILKLNYDLLNSTSEAESLRSCDDVVSRSSNSSHLIAEYASYSLSCPYENDSNY